jgi:hypothetical protein
MFRFTIRDILWLTVVVALGCAWRVDREYWRSVAKGWHGEFLNAESIIMELKRRF